MKKKAIMSITLCILLVNIHSIYSEIIDIKVRNNYLPGERLDARIVLYDSYDEVLEKPVSYKIQNYYSDVMLEGKSVSGEIIDYVVPNDAIQGPWKISAYYDGIETNRLFNIGKLESAEIKIVEDELVMRNIGNVVYEKPVLIYIGEEHQTINMRIEVNEEKKMKITAPKGVYTVRINDGTREENLVFNGVRLTGNVVGLEAIDSSPFWVKYPVVVLFLVALVVLSAIMFSSRLFTKKKQD